MRIIHITAQSQVQLFSALNHAAISQNAASYLILSRIQIYPRCQFQAAAATSFGATKALLASVAIGVLVAGGVTAGPVFGLGKSVDFSLQIYIYSVFYDSGGSDPVDPVDPQLPSPNNWVDGSTTSSPIISSPPSVSQNITEAPGTGGGDKPTGEPQVSPNAPSATPTPTPTRPPITGSRPTTTTLKTTTTTRNATG